MPQEWYDLYPLEGIALAPNREPPLRVPPIAMNSILVDGWAGDFADFKVGAIVSASNSLVMPVESYRVC